MLLKTVKEKYRPYNLGRREYQVQGNHNFKIVAMMGLQGILPWQPF